MASEAKPFLWPKFFYGDTVKPPPAAFYELFEEAWKQDTWDLQKLGVPCRNVLEDSAPILLQSRVLRVDSMKAYRNRKYLYDEWTEKVPVWHLHWINESRLLWFLGSEDEERLVQWLLKGMDSLWFSIAMLNIVGILRSRFINHFDSDLPDMTIANPVAELFLRKVAGHMLHLNSLDGRFAAATGAKGLTSNPTTPYLSFVRELLCRTGRMEFDIYQAWRQKPFHEVQDDFMKAFELPPGVSTFQLPGMNLIKIPGTPEKRPPPEQELFDY